MKKKSNNNLAYIWKGKIKNLAGIYIHIPFCKKICYYCDFYKSANYRYVDEFIDAILKEISYKKGFTKEVVETIYFGGGTPSTKNPANFTL